MPAISRKRAIAYLAIVLLLLGLGGKLVLGGGDPAPETRAQTLSVIEAESGAASPSGPDLLVHVAGAVRRPGLYRVASGSRVADAIQKAGGAKPIAELDLVNLAAPVADGQQIVVPRRSTGATTAGTAEPRPVSGPLNLNTATLEQLDALPGVGPVTAEKILDYRSEHGSFRSVEELDAVPGIGPTRLAELRELVVV
jgi:competence protein ComEA